MTINGLTVGDFAQVLATFFAAIAAIVAALQVRAMSMQIQSQEKSEDARIFKEIADRWSDIYANRNDVLGAQIFTKELLLQSFGNDYKSFLQTEEWARLRGVCNFFEFLGVVLKEGYIDPDPLFVLVTVDVFIDIHNGQQILVPDGVMYSRLRGPIEYLREVYRPDLYWWYDKYLLVEYKKHRPAKPPAA